MVARLGKWIWQRNKINARCKNWRGPENGPVLRRKSNAPVSFLGLFSGRKQAALKTNIDTAQQLCFAAEKSLKLALARTPTIPPRPFLDLLFYRQTQRPIASNGLEPNAHTSKRRRATAFGPVIGSLCHP